MRMENNIQRPLESNKNMLQVKTVEKITAHQLKIDVGYRMSMSLYSQLK